MSAPITIDGFGVGVRHQNLYAAEDIPKEYINIVNSLNANWFYNWVKNPKLLEAEPQKYAPMQYHMDGLWDWENFIALFRQYNNRTWLLGNEPEAVGQGNNTPEEFYAALVALDKAHDLSNSSLVYPNIAWTPGGRKWIQTFIKLLFSNRRMDLLPSAWGIHIYGASTTEQWQSIYLDAQRTLQGNTGIDNIVVTETCGYVYGVESEESRYHIHQDIMASAMQCMFMYTRLQATAWFCDWTEQGGEFQDCSLYNTRLGNYFRNMNNKIYLPIVQTSTP